MTKDELVNQVATKTGLTLNQTHAVIQASLETIQQALANQRKVEFRNFGVFRPVMRAPRKGRNPRDISKVYEIPARCVVKFKMGNVLEAALNPVAKPTDAAPLHDVT